MKFGKIRIENKNLIFTKRMRINSLPCEEIVFADRDTQIRRDDGESQEEAAVFVMTKQNKKYRFPMKDKEANRFMEYIRTEFPSILTERPYKNPVSLQSLPNTIDLGGIANQEGRVILPGKLLRSGELYHVSRMDQKYLTENCRLKTVIDLRTPGEIHRKPDTQMEGVSYIENPVVDEMTAEITHETGLLNFIDSIDRDPEEYWKKFYRELVLDPYSVNKYAEFLDYLAEQKEGAVLWHSSLGKDRAGVATALLLWVLQVPEETILEDFTNTSKFLEGEMEYMLRLCDLNSEKQKKRENGITACYQAKREYLEEVFRTIEKSYGSMEIFLRKKLYVTSKMAEALQKKYLI